MSLAGCRSALLCLISLACAAAPAWADDTEERSFSIFVDGKDAGKSTMKITQKDDGTCYMAANCNVKFRHLLVVDYKIDMETQEWWKNGQLIGLNTKCNDNGKRTEVTVFADNMMLRLRVSGAQDRYIKNDSWCNSFWKLADAKFHNKTVPILESDSGKEYSSELKYVDTQQLKIGNQLQDCYHFRVQAAAGPVDLWYDRYHRIVRQEFTESGHKTVVQLVHIKR
ncbi:MAG TPA: DUF6134 family protein [Gemmataceae bacterium]|nr:DUF6134 family protein [Gemmataceae bacterium]